MPATITESVGHTSRTVKEPAFATSIVLAEWVPTPEEIAATCAEIQAEWSSKERRKRRGLPAKYLVKRQPDRYSPVRIHRLTIGGGR